MNRNVKASAVLADDDICGKLEAVDHPAACLPTRNLLAKLSRAGIRYCHWKSNIRLAESLAGEEDLDLLVARESAPRFHAVLAEAGFRQGVSRGGTGHPGVLHAFALDPQTMRLVHVHAYFRVLTGDSLVKSYALPIGQDLLAGDHRLLGVRVPPPEAELVTFLLRIALKHTGLVETLMVSRDYRVVVEELSWLRSRSNEAAARALWQAHVPKAPELFDKLLEAIGDRSAILRRLRLGRRLARCTRDWRRLGLLPILASRTRRIGFMLHCRWQRRRPIALHDGGAIIAFVGPKASGKSTLGDAVAKRLGRKLDIRRVHVGKPPSSAVSAPVHMLLPVLRRVLSRERSSEYEKPERRSAKQFSLAFICRMVLLALDRRSLLLRCRRDAISGTVILADRYPSDVEGAIDSSQFNAEAIEACRSSIKRALMRLERALCRDVPKPDLVIRLSASLETALLRDARRIKAEGPDPDALRRRRDLETGMQFADTPVLELNADRDLESTIRDAMAAIWQRL